MKKISNNTLVKKRRNFMLRGKICGICSEHIVADEVYCDKCWRVVNAIMLEPDRFLMVLKKLRNCKLCAKACKNWEQET